MRHIACIRGGRFTAMSWAHWRAGAARPRAKPVHWD